MPLLEMKGLTIDFRTLDGVLRAVHGAELTVEPGEIVGLVGESGCGKSQTCLSIPRLIHPSGRVRADLLRLDGVDLTALSEREMRRIRGDKVSMIFQEPMTSLNPCITIGEQLSEPLVLHRGQSWAQARGRVIEVLGQVGIPDPARRVREFPHQLSGGMRQRAMIAMALVCEPRLLIADEPTTALDVTVQAQILTLMRRLRDETRAAVLLVTHNLGVVAQVCDRVTVMYAGRMVESAPVRPLFARPGHPYTRGLMRSVPRLRVASGEVQRLEAIPGTVPGLWEVPPGCPFHPRCGYAEEICRREFPSVREVAHGHTVACHFSDRVREEGAA